MKNNRAIPNNCKYELFNRLPYDTCASEQSQRVSEGAGKYQLERLGRLYCKPQLQIEIDSELKLITTPATNCNHNSSAKYDASSFPICQSIPVENTRLINPPSTMRCQGVNRFETLFHNPQLNSFVTRDYLTYNVPSRIVVKDNFKPFLEVPSNQAKFLPILNSSDVTFNGIAGIQSMCASNVKLIEMPSVTWKTFERQ